MSYDAPHILLLDEPTNHLDIDSREALVMALNDYDGAVIIVSHDPSMVERVADRLWIVKDGKCDIYNGDIDDYRKLIIKERRENRKKDKAKKETPKEKKDKVSLSTLKFRAEEAEKLIAKLTKEKEEMEDIMADADFYKHPENVKVTQNAYNAMLKDLEKQEAIWMEAIAATEEQGK